MLESLTYPYITAAVKHKYHLVDPRFVKQTAVCLSGQPYHILGTMPKWTKSQILHIKDKKFKIKDVLSLKFELCMCVLNFELCVCSLNFKLYTSLLVDAIFHLPPLFRKLNIF